MLIVRTPVRVSFAGGGTDLPSFYEKHGGMVLSASIDKYVYTILTEREDEQIQVISSDLKALETCERIEKMEFEGTELEIPFAVLKHQRSAGGINLFIASEVPPGTGLGSSASVCISVLKALCTYSGQGVSSRELAETAFYIARELLRRPVGKQDEYAAAVGGLNLLKFDLAGVQVERIRLPQEMLLDFEQNLLLFFTGSSRNSSEILVGQDQSLQRNEDQVVDALISLKSLVPRMCEAFLGGDFPAFGRLLDESWKIKKTVSNKISNPRIEQIYQAALECGALGGKITGAGGGGFLLLFCEMEKQASVRAAMRAFGLKEMRFHLDLGGNQVVYNDPFYNADGRGGMRWVFSPALEDILR